MSHVLLNPEPRPAEARDCWANCGEGWFPAVELDARVWDRLIFDFRDQLGNPGMPADRVEIQEERPE